MASLQRVFAKTLFLSFFIAALPHGWAAEPDSDQHLLYVATPGVRNYLEYGGHGLIVFDMRQNHAFVKRIPTAGLGDDGQPLNVKGVCASAKTQRIYVGTTRQLMCLDLVTERLLWERPYEGGCDRMAISPLGDMIYLPSLEGPHWHVVDAATGDVLKRIVPNSGSHNTVCGLDGRRFYLAGLKSPLLTIADGQTHEISGTVGPFSASIRPFTIDAAQRYCYVNVNDLLGFEVGEISSGKMLHRVEVNGVTKGPTKRHGCPSHGIGLTPDGRELWVTDAANSRMHVFDATVMPPRQVGEIHLRDQPGWITFSLDGRFAYPSTGDVIDVATRTIVATLTDERGRAVQSEKMVELVWRGGVPVNAGDQFGLGRSR